tara:strand:+ start:1054 stop:1191 length:138 start_codon:yes stop_codon:yes gene_type:complete
MGSEKEAIGLNGRPKVSKGTLKGGEETQRGQRRGKEGHMRAKRVI